MILGSSPVVLVDGEPVACSSEPDRWHPERETPTSTEWARAVCRRCPIVEACRQFALDNHPVHGVWGATTRKQRAELLGETTEEAEDDATWGRNGPEGPPPALGPASRTKGRKRADALV